MNSNTEKSFAELANVDPAAFTLFMQRKFPADWINVAMRTDEALTRLYDRLDREAQMPIRTPMVMATLAMVRLLIDDGGIGVGSRDHVRADA